jgi:hypothetical protein
MEKYAAAERRPALALLVSAATKESGNAGRQVVGRRRKQSRALVETADVNSPRCYTHKIRYDLVWEWERWAIDDIHFVIGKGGEKCCALVSSPWCFVSDRA